MPKKHKCEHAGWKNEVRSSFCVLSLKALALHVSSVAPEITLNLAASLVVKLRSKSFSEPDALYYIFFQYHVYKKLSPHRDFWLGS